MRMRTAAGCHESPVLSNEAFTQTSSNVSALRGLGLGQWSQRIFWTEIKKKVVVKRGRRWSNIVFYFISLPDVTRVMFNLGTSFNPPFFWILVYVEALKRHGR